MGERGSFLVDIMLDECGLAFGVPKVWRSSWVFDDIGDGLDVSVLQYACEVFL